MSWTKPFPEPDWVSKCGNAILYNRDCLEVLPLLPEGSVESVVTDPPWIAGKKGVVRRGKGVAKVVDASIGIGYGSIGEFNSSAIDEMFRVCRHDMFVICGFKELGEVIQSLAPIRGCFIWHKPNGGISVAYPSPLDVAYVVWGAKVSKITGHQHWRSGVMSHCVPTAGCISNGERILNEPNGKATHPCQGPLSLYEQLVTPLHGCVMDCYTGTGTTGVAALRLGRKFIGIEIEPKYFEIAKKRIEQEATRFPLFEEPKPEQASLFDDAEVLTGTAE